jgi:small GTP-binding protein
MFNNYFSSSLEEANTDYDEEIKIIVVGETGVGKSNIIIRYNGGEFEPNSIPNNGSSFIVKYYTFGNKVYRINVWDTAGQEKYHSLTKIFVKDSQIALLVYAINDSNSFEQLDYWYNMVKDACNNIIFSIIGNKIDLLSEEKVDLKKAKEKANQYNAMFQLTSALNDDSGIDEIIEKLVKEYIKSLGRSIEIESLKDISSNIKLDKRLINSNDTNRAYKGKRKKKCCT